MESTSAAGTTFSPDAAAMQLNDTFANCQSQPQTVDCACQPRVYAMEAVKDTLQMLVRDTQPVIADDDKLTSAALSCGLEARFSRSRVGLHWSKSR